MPEYKYGESVLSFSWRRNQGLSYARLLASEALWERPSGSGAAVREAARQAAIKMSGALLTRINEQAYAEVFRLMVQDHVDALIVSDEPDHLPYFATIAELATKARIVAIYPYRAFVDAGGLMAYSTDLVDVQRRCANIVSQILNGKKPGEIPFYQQIRFDLVITKTAKALDLVIPATLLASADDVIE
jgi:putative ABC transport system substrate-binding protein